MMRIPTKTITYGKISHIGLDGDFHQAKEPRKNITLLYFHGGGLVYGSRQDLPDVFLSRFLESGYDVLTLDYPLYPESPMAEIVKACRDALSWFLTQGQAELGLQSTDYILFGRSAGGFLVNHLTAAFAHCPPKKVISLYSYFDLHDGALSGPSVHYKSFPAIHPHEAARMIHPHAVTEGALTKRYLLYVYLRQTGTWLDSRTRDDLSLAEDALKAFPPTFLTASDTDRDVPFQQSRRMKALIPQSVFFPVMDADHDYDRNFSSPLAKTLYDKILLWLEQ